MISGRHSSAESEKEGHLSETLGNPFPLSDRKWVRSLFLPLFTQKGTFAGYQRRKVHWQWERVDVCVRLLWWVLRKQYLSPPFISSPVNQSEMTTVYLLFSSHSVDCRCCCKWQRLCLVVFVFTVFSVCVFLIFTAAAYFSSCLAVSQQCPSRHNNNIVKIWVYQPTN